MNTCSLQFFKAFFALLFAAAIFMGQPPHASAAPAAPGLRTFTQPDGTTFQGRGHGDEFFCWYETADHHPITWEEATGRWMYALPAAEGIGPSSGIAVGAGPAPGQRWRPLMPEAELEAAKTHTYEASVPPVKRGRTRGQGGLAVNSNTVMLLTTFSHPTTGAAIPTIYTAAEFETAFFDTSDPDAFTFANLFKQMSYGLHTPTSGPAGIQNSAQAPQTHDYYGGGPTVPGSLRENGVRVDELVRWRAQNADATIDYGPYDTDNDTFVDLVCVVYQGTSQASSNQVNDIWPIRSNLINPYTTGDTNAEGETVIVRDFIVVSELNPSEPGNATPMTTIGLMAHEYGHGIGWPDLYDRPTANATTDPDSSGLGNWCLMATGTYNQASGGRQGDRPCWANARLRWQCGWVTPQGLTRNRLDYVINEAKTENQVVRMAKDGASLFEYYLLEYRTPTGFDAGLPGAGLLIWHVDESVTTDNENEWWNRSAADRRINSGHYMIALEQADGNFQLEKGTNSGDSADAFRPGSSFGDTTIPSSRNYAGLNTLVAVNNIRISGSALSADLYVKADAEFPSVYFTNPADGVNNYVYVPSLQGTASDNAGVSKVKVALRRNGGGGAGEEWYDWTSDNWEGGAYDFGRHEKTATGTTSWSVGILAGRMTPGSYTAFANATDTSNAESGWKFIGFSVIENANGPNILYSSPAAHADLNSAALSNFTGTVANWTGDSTKRFVLEKISEVPGGAGSYLDWSTNSFGLPGEFGAEHQTDQINSANTWTVALAGRGLGRGRYAMWAKLYTSDARESPWQQRFFRIDYPPVVTVISPRHGSSSTTMSTISGTCLEPTGTGAVGGGVRFTLTDTLGRFWTGSSWSGTSTILVAPISGLSWHYDSIPSGASLTPGLFYISASLTTNSGESAASVAGQNQTQFRVDTSPPALTISSPLSGSTISTPVLPAFGGTASDVGGIAWVNAFIRRESDLAYWTGYSWSADSEEAPEAEGAGEIFAAPTVAYLSTNFTPAGGPWSCTSTMPRPGIDMLTGSYKFIVMAGDAAGNYIQVDAPVTVNYHASFHWVGTHSNEWEYAPNWRDSLNLYVPRAPGAHDIAVLGTGTVNARDSRTVYSFQLTGGTINVSDVPAQPTVITSLTPAIWSDGTISGVLQIPVGMHLDINPGGAGRTLGTSSLLVNHGTVTQNALAPIVGYSGVRVENRFDGVWRFTGAGDPFDNFSGGNSFRNDGLVEKTGAGILTLTDWVFDMPGETRSSSIIEFNSDTLFLTGSLFSGTGTVRWNGLIDLQGTITQNAAFFEMTGGTVTCSAGATIVGTWEWKGGNIQNTMNVPSGSTLKILTAADHTLNISSVLVNRGTVQWIGPGPIIGYSGSLITNEAGARFEALSAGDIFDNFSGGNVFENDGLFVKTGGTGVTTINDWVLNNRNEIRADTGGLDFGGEVHWLAGTRLRGPGTFRQRAHTYLHGPTIMEAPVIFYEGELTAAPAASITGTLEWRSGTLDGTCRILSGSTLLLVSGDKTLATGSIIQNSGTVDWQSGDLIGYSTVLLDNLAGSTFRTSAGGSFVNFSNGNKVRVASGAQMLKTGATTAHLLWEVDINGTCDVQGGTLSMEQGGTSSGAFTSAAGTTLIFAAGDFKLKNGASVLGAGTHQVTAAGVYAEAAATGRFSLQGGTLGSTGTGVLTLTGANQWTSGYLEGSTTVPAGATLTLSTAVAKIMNTSSLLTNQGTVEFQTGAQVVGYSGVTIENTTAGVVRLAGDITPFADFSSGNVFRNRGTLQKTSGTGTALLNAWSLDHFGTLGTATGILDLSLPITFQPGAHLSGPGRIRSSTGSLAVRGTTTLDSGTFEFVGGTLGGHADGTARLTAAGGAAIEWTGGYLDGTVTFAGTSGISGPAGKQFDTSAILKNAGVMTVSGGSLLGYSSATLRNLAGATLRIAPGMTFTDFGGGNVLLNDGTLEITGTGTVTSPWAFTQSATGTLRAPVAAVGPGLISGVLESSVSTFAGSFVAIVPAGLTPPANAEFFPVTYSSNSGAFASVLSSSGGNWQATYETGRVRIRVPGSALTFDNWAAAAGLSGANALPGEDPDKDGQTNFAEYVFNSSPTVGSPAPQNAAVATIGGQPWLTLNYRRWADRENAGVTYTAQGGEGLGNWGTGGIIDEVDPAAPVIAGSTACRCRVPIGGALQFLRVLATKP